MEINKTRYGDVELAYVRQGPEDGMPLMLVNGAGGQLVQWPPDLCDEFVRRGFQVARMDLRDTGLSTHLAQYDVPRKQRPPRYTLRDMTDDIIAVFDALGWSTAHLFGASEGGMVAQATATYHPDRVRSLTSVCSTPTNSLLVNRPKLWPNLKGFMAMRKPSADREAEGRKFVALFRAVGSPGYPIDEDHWREFGRQSFDRGLNPRGDLRHAAAIWAAGDRRRELGAVRCPTLVIHGEADPMVSPRAGKATADAIPGARLVLYPGMGHDLPRALWPEVLDEVTTLTTHAEAIHSGG